MAETSSDAGVIQAILVRFEKQTLPRALDLKAAVERGELLGEMDIEFLEEVFRDSQEIMPLVNKHPPLQPLATQAMDLYRQITDKALENEQAFRSEKS